jgi:hypothetical protein
MHSDGHAAEGHTMAALAYLPPFLAWGSSLLCYQRAAIVELVNQLRQISSHYTDRHMILFAGKVH